MRAIDFVIAALLLFLMALDSGCIGLIGAQQLTADQIAAMRDYNGDVYVCALIEAGVRSGSLTLVVVPKGADIKVVFGADCHLK